MRVGAGLAKGILREQHSVAALGAVDLKDEIEDALSYVFDSGLITQSPADLVEKGEQSVFAAKKFDAGFAVDPGFGPFGRRFGPGAIKKLCDAFPVDDLCEMRSEFRGGFSDHSTGGHILKTELYIAETDNIAAVQLGAIDADAIDEDTVGAMLVGDNPRVVIGFEQGMASGDAGVRKRDVVGCGATDVNGRAFSQFVKTRLGAGPFDN